MIEYKTHFADEYEFMQSVFFENKPIGGIVARSMNEREVNLHYLMVKQESNLRHTHNQIGTSLHRNMVTWAKDTQHKVVTAELVPKDPKDYDITVNFLDKMGYVCIVEVNEYKFGFLLDIGSE